MTCTICGHLGPVDKHHIIPRSRGGKHNETIHAPENLIALCRSCHHNLHIGLWRLVSFPDGFRLLDMHSGEQVMRRYTRSMVDVPALFQSLGQMDASLTKLFDALPFIADDELVELFSTVASLGKRSWLLQAAILHETQQRSIHGDQALQAVANRFGITVRQAQKYSLVWKTFFSKDDTTKNVNVDAFTLDESSWYVVAATETEDPTTWLGYAQDKKAENPSYSISAFRQDILSAHPGPPEISAPPEVPAVAIDLPSIEPRPCPWVKPMCLRSGRPVPIDECACEFRRPPVTPEIPESAEMTT